MAKKATFRPQAKNANRHTMRGLKMLEDAMGRSGYVAPMTATADGEVIDGSARLEVAATVFDGVEPLVVDHDGTRPVIMRRTDIPSADDPRAKRIALEANRIAAVDLEWDAELLAKFAAEEPATLAGLWDDAELAAVLGGFDFPDEAPPDQPVIESECLVEVRCTRAFLDSIRATLDEWADNPNVTIDIS